MSSLVTIDQAGNLLDTWRPELEPMIQENGKSYDRLKAVFLIAVQQNPDILKCSPISIKRELSKCAADGLVPDNKEAAMIAYKGELQYQPMVLGIIKRMKELGGVFNIVCNLVFEKDEFVLNEADPDSLVHKSDPFSKDRGAVVGGYVAFRDESKRLMHLETMSLDDFQKVRKASKAPESPAWRNWTNEMYRKAVLRRGAKYISIDNTKIRQLIERHDDMFEFNQPRVVDRVNPFTGEVIEHSEVAQIAHQETVTVDTSVRASPEKEAVVVKQDAKQPAKETSPAAKPQEDRLPLLPNVTIDRDDLQDVVAACTEILATALKAGTPSDRKAALKESASAWATSIPEYARPLIKSCIDMSDWAIKRDGAGQKWIGDHSAFTLAAAALLEVDKLNIGNYP